MAAERWYDNQSAKARLADFSLLAPLARWFSISSVVEAPQPPNTSKPMGTKVVRSGWMMCGVYVLRLVSSASVAAAPGVRKSCRLRNACLNGCVTVTSYRIRSEEHTSELQSLMSISYA